MSSARRHRRALNIPGHAHELTFTCFHRYQFLASERTRRWLADAIEAARIRLRFNVIAYVIMPEHVHLLIMPLDAAYDMAAILRAIKEPVGRRAIQHMQRHTPTWLTRVTRQRGARIERLFWQSGGGYDRNIDNPQTLWSTIDYLHANPVRRGLAEREIDWVWSSARQYAGLDDGPIRVDPPPQ